MEDYLACDLVRCESCRTPMLTYFTTDDLIIYVCPSCIDWSATEIITINSNDASSNKFLSVN